MALNTLRPLPALVPDPAGFWAKVDQSGGLHACWLWKGARFHYGHGAYKIARRPWGAHRVAYQLTFGPAPAGRYVLHICDNAPCCNPTHLYLGSLRDNAWDQLRRGRHTSQRRSARNAA